MVCPAAMSRRAVSKPRPLFASVMSVVVMPPGSGLAVWSASAPVFLGVPGPAWHRVAGGRSGRAGQGGEQAELFGAAGAGLRVVDDEQLPLRPANAELLAADREVPDLGVVDPDRGALAGLNVVPGPQLPESVAGQGQLADELDEAGVVGIGSDGLAEAGDQPGGGSVPIRVQRYLGRVEEHRAEPVLPGLQVGRQGAGEAVGGEDVEVAALDEGRKAP